MQQNHKSNNKWHFTNKFWSSSTSAVHDSTYSWCCSWMRKKYVLYKNNITAAMEITAGVQQSLMLLEYMNQTLF